MTTAIFTIVYYAFTIYQFMVIAYVLMSWVPQMRETPIGQLLERLVEPYLAPFRRFIPPLGFIDISPIVALIALNFAHRGLNAILQQLLL
ncbi:MULTISPECIES: YggT family protein [Bacillales]|jgi:YggT family protein|uniref:Cell division protein n=1 Tax=Brevibacillus aydinogluensis TaxID=927786 RepID=A0AA48M657_9BACL|nr:MULTISPECIES: YggT family protein [Bacillales]REK61834.1 MAG: YggT family protein [Brevibacillus sp.]MBR8658138.1 YggT family protein [Brevibacillus sp. NL20B1]MDT3414827.1 YggT family protein [Brevibacillus aydinogluensis]NNV01521.1 YggT family protein [Brevibacillus sp. MCWH]UFJ61169.1 YggT family protein [Anoxybacillus sediminis]